MSIQATSSAPPQPTSKKQSFWRRWRRPRIAEVDASTLFDDPALSTCYDGSVDSRINDAPHSRSMARVARWEGATVGGVALEVRDRTSFLRVLHVDAAWRGCGVGRRLLQGIVQRARLQFVRDIYVRATAADAGFYALHGFRPVDGEEARGALAHFGPDALPTSDLASKARILLRRRLAAGFVSVPYDGVTVKM